MLTKKIPIQKILKLLNIYLQLSKSSSSSYKMLIPQNIYRQHFKEVKFILKIFSNSLIQTFQNNLKLIYTNDDLITSQCLFWQLIRTFKFSLYSRPNKINAYLKIFNCNILENLLIVSKSYLKLFHEFLTQLFHIRHICLGVHLLQNDNTYISAYE